MARTGRQAHVMRELHLVFTAVVAYIHLLTHHPRFQAPSPCCCRVDGWTSEEVDQYGITYSKPPKRSGFDNDGFIGGLDLVLLWDPSNLKENLFLIWK